jgi:inositol 1,4,5-triphosphate receptor type 3
MYLFLTILAEKFNIRDAEKVKKYTEKETIESKVSDVREIITQSNVEEDTLLTKLTSLINIGSPNIKLKRVKPSDHNNINDKIIAAKFFSKIVKKCEFRTENEDELQLKIIYFICDPHYYYISKNNIQNFFKYVDRTSAKQKLGSLLENLDTFFFEIEFKKEVNRKAKYKLFFLQIDYNKINIYNFIISSLINMLLLFFLKDEERGRESHSLNYTINVIVFFQILLNVLYLYMFYISKYGFYISLLQNKLGKDHKLTLKEKINLYILDSFVLNDEIYLIFFIIITSILGLFLKYNAFLFALQLLTIIKFIDIIREILSAFKLKLFELLEAIEVLAIIIYFVANFEFFFLIDEFNIEVGDKIENFCQNLLECTINIFNHGIRAGGGIGDLLEAKSYDDKYLYFLRFFCDLLFYIVCMLLSLNIISSIIVNTFSQIREDSNQKEEDQKNRCFICNISRIEFQKNKIDIGFHRKYEHNTNNYIKFFVFLWNIDEKDMDADQSFINNCMKEKDIKFFPMNCSKSIGEVENDDEED